MATKRKNEIPKLSRAVVMKRADLRCERCGTGTNPGHWHHRRSRSVKDDHTHCPCNGVLLCPTCHSQVHATPFSSRGEGFIVSRSSLPRMQYFHRWDGALILPKCDGGYEFAQVE